MDPNQAWEMFKAGAKDWYAGGIDKIVNNTDAPPFNNFQNSRAVLDAMDTKATQPSVKNEELETRQEILPRMVKADVWRPTPVPVGQSLEDKKMLNMAESNSISEAVPRRAGSAVIDFPTPTNLSQQEKNLLALHRDNLRTGNFINKDGVYTTQALIGVRGPDGRVYNIPSFWGGAVRSPEMSAMMASRVGWDKFPSYRSGDEANRAAQALHPIVADDAKRYDSWKSAQPMNQAAEQNAKNMEMMAKAGGAPVGSAVGRLMQWMNGGTGDDQLPKGARPMEGESPFATFRQRWPQEIWPSSTQNKEGVPMSPRIERPEYALPNQYPPMNDPIRRAHEELNEAMFQKVNRVKDKKERYIGANTEESAPVPKTDRIRARPIGQGTK